MINRDLYGKVKDKLINGQKIIVLYGARQVGKTTLIRQIIDDLGYKTRYINADLLKYHDVLSSRDIKQLSGLVNGYDLLFIDEAQRIDNLDINLKIMHEEIPGLRIVATGSSSLDLAYKINDSLAGRKATYTMYPLSLSEISGFMSPFDIKDNLEDFLLYGLYPEVFTTSGLNDKLEVLEEITNSYLYKDVLELANVRNSRVIHMMLELLAYRVGSEISINKLSQEVGMSREAVIRYLDLLEKSFVIFRLPGYSRNLAKEVKKMDKYYFYDLGIRNMLIEDFRPVDRRQDIGGMWENFIIAERMKYIRNRGGRNRFYFWRVYTGGEVDLVETLGKKIKGFEIKYSNKKITKPSKTWLEIFKDAEYHTINRDNFLDFLL
jgi:predicted AAA+ superfamily ATPase